MIQIFGRKKCKDSRSAERWLKERGVKFQFIDMDEKAPSPGELDAIAKALGGHDALLDKEGKLWKDRGLSWQEVEPRALLLEDPALCRSPLLRQGKDASAGFDKAFLERAVKAEKGV